MIYVRGKCKGIRSVPDRDPNFPPKIYVGFGAPKANGYTGEEQVIEVRFSKDQIKNGFHNQFQDLQGKMVEVQVFVSVNAKNDRAFTDYFCQGVPVVLAVAPPLAKVS